MSYLWFVLVDKGNSLVLQTFNLLLCQACSLHDLSNRQSHGEEILGNGLALTGFTFFDSLLDTFLNALFQYRLTDLAFGQLTEPFISDFHHYLLDEKGFSSGTITIYVSLFKKMCRIAFERGLCKNLLFAHYRVGTPRVTTPKALSMSDFIKIRDVELPEDKPRLSVSRDLFLFACYAGTAFIDTVSITKANVKVLEDGDKWLIYNRKKTGTLARVKLLPEALELMAKYEDEARDTLFPLLSTNRVRIDLITICKLAETSKTYSYHVASHNKIFY